MTYPLPTRSAGDSAANHVADHNEIHGILGLGLSTSLTTASTGHLANHNKIHTVLNTIQGQTLPTGIVAGGSSHLSHHNTIHALLNAETYGPRGAVGQRATTDIAEFPSSFTSSHSTFASLQSAVAAAGTGRVFRITASMTFTAQITPHTNDEFWGNDGVTITKGGTTHSAFGAGGVTGVRIMNLVITGFSDTTGGSNPGAVRVTSASNGWEIAYCEMTGNGFSYNISGTSGGAHTTDTWVHHNYIHGNGINTVEVNLSWGAIHASRTLVEDNEWTGSGDSGKWAANGSDSIIRHNYVHGISGRQGGWFDTQTQSALVEWNIFDTCQVGMEFESCSKKWFSSTLTDAGDLNVLRYNKFTNNLHVGLRLFNDRHVEVHGNIFDGNGTSDAGNNWGALHVQQRVDDYPVNGYVLDYTSVHHNYFRTISTSKYPMKFLLATDLPDYANYYTQTGHHNNWDYNTYDAATVGSGTNQFTWNGNKTFAQWQAVAQSSEGTGATQDVHGARS